MSEAVPNTGCENDVRSVGDDREDKPRAAIMREMMETDMDPQVLGDRDLEARAAIMLTRVRVSVRVM